MAKTNHERYRVGLTENGDTTLTVLSPDGLSMTLTMNATATKRLIKMLASTLEDEDTESTVDNQENIIID